MTYYLRDPREPRTPGCALLAFAIILLVNLAFWGLVAYGIWEGIQYLQRH